MFANWISFAATPVRYRFVVRLCCVLGDIAPLYRKSEISTRFLLDTAFRLQ